MDSSSIFQTCVQKELPNTQTILNSLKMRSSSLNEYEKLKAAFLNYKEWPVRSIIKIYIGSPPSNIRINRYSSMSGYDPNRNLIKLDPLQSIVNSTSFTYLNIVDMIKRVVNERFSPITNLTFQFVTDISISNIRISFTNTGSWSYLGTDCNRIPKDNATMNFGWFEISVVLHEFGHALGMVHEHQSAFGNQIQWNLPKVYNWAKTTQGWDAEQTDMQILDKYDRTEINGSTFDPKSVMLYFYPADLTLDNKGTSINPRLSQVDTIYLNSKYPGSAQTPQQFYLNVYGENILTDTSTTPFPSTTPRKKIPIPYVNNLSSSTNAIPSSTQMQNQKNNKLYLIILVVCLFLFFIILRHIFYLYKKNYN